MEPGSEEAQRDAWTNMVKKVHGAINRVTVETVDVACKALFRVNLVRARGVFCKTVLRAQFGSPGLSDVFAAVIAVVNSRLPEIVALFIARLVAQLKEAYEAQDRELCFATGKFVACLCKQQVVGELLVLEFLMICLVDPSDGSVELAVETLRECAGALSERAPKACESIFQKLRGLLHEGSVGQRAQAMIEGVMSIRKKRLDGADILDPRLDLLHDDDIITHFPSLYDERGPDLQRECNTLQMDPNFLENEKEYDEIRKIILGAEYDDVIATHGVEVTATQNENLKEGITNVRDQAEQERPVAQKTKDMTGSELVEFRRSVYLIFSSGISYEEWAHKVLRFMQQHSGKEMELCKMVIECCSEEKSFLRSYGLLGHRLCMLSKTYVLCFEETFATHYATIHNFVTRKIRNIACFYAALLASDALSWDVMQVVKLIAEETTSSSRMFLKYLFKEVAKTLGKSTMSQRFKLGSLKPSLQGIFPTDTAPHAVYAINFFNNIGLSYLTVDLFERVQSLPKENQVTAEEEDFSSDSSSSLSSSSLSSSSEEDEDRADRQSIDPVGSKRANEQTSPSINNRPTKIRNLDRGEARR